MRDFTKGLYVNGIERLDEEQVEWFDLWVSKNVNSILEGKNILWQKISLDWAISNFSEEQIQMFEENKRNWLPKTIAFNFIQNHYLNLLKEPVYSEYFEITDIYREVWAFPTEIYNKVWRLIKETKIEDEYFRKTELAS